MKASHANTNRPGLESARRRSFGAWFVQEWGLMLLAAVLAIIIWEITSTQVIREQRIEGVRVELVVAPADREVIGAVLDQADATVTLEMTCSERERHAVHAALLETGGGTPVLRLKIHPEVKEEARDISSIRDVWLWPVSNAADIHMHAAMPAGRVYRIEGVQQVHIARPPTIPDAETLRAQGYVLDLLDPDTPESADIRLGRAFLEFRAPRALFAAGDRGLSMTPDAIDLRPLLAEEPPPLGKRQTFELSFNGWRRAADLGRKSPEERSRIAQYRSRLALPTVNAELVLQRVAEREVKGRLEVLLHPAFTWDFDGQKPGGFVGESTPFDFTGRLQGPKDALDEIEAQPEAWMWAMWVAAPHPDGWPKGNAMGEETTRKGVRANIVWVPLDPAWVRRGVRFVPDPDKGQDNFFLKIALRGG